ncbi:hypothetical protein LCGC14_1219010 [marine sediment metagenome]|uniref:Uncharacterized protein n=1 Tax=marine sediment metagenome TaxID=412755 RepID=A0A0F9LZ61_9ZZZZ
MAISPDTIAQGFSGLLNQSSGSILTYFGYFFWSGLVLGGFWLVYIFLQYKIKYTYGIVGSSGKYGSELTKEEQEKEIDEMFADPAKLAKITIRGIKNDRIRSIRKDGALMWKTLFGREIIEPFEYRHVYPNNVVMGVKLGKDAHIPAVFNIRKPEALVEPIERSVRFWETVTAQQTNMEYSDFKTRMLPTFITLGTIIFCLVFTGIMLWFSWRYGYMGATDIASALRSPGLAEIAGSIAPN